MRGDLDTARELFNNHGLCLVEKSLNKYGWTPLHTACYFGQIDIVEYLIKDLKANPNKASS